MHRIDHINLENLADYDLHAPRHHLLIFFSSPAGAKIDSKSTIPPTLWIYTAIFKR